MLFYAELSEHLVERAYRQPDHVIIIAFNALDELRRRALYRIPSSLVVPFRLVPVMCMPYTTTGFNQVPYMVYTDRIL